MASDLALVFVFIAIILGTVTQILKRYILKETNPYAYSLATQIISGLIFLPFAIINFSLPQELIAYAVLAFASILWSLVSISTYISYKQTEISIRDPIGQSKLLWALLFGVLFLGEMITSHRIIGTSIIFLGVVILIWSPKRKFGKLSDPGIRWTLLAAILNAMVFLLDKASLRWFVPEVYGFFVYLFPMFILVLFLKKRKHHISHLFKIRAKSTILSIVLSAVAYYFTLKAFSLADFTLVYPLLQLTTLLTVVGGIFIMKEKENLWQKIIASVLIIIGAIILKF